MRVLECGWGVLFSGIGGRSGEGGVMAVEVGLADGEAGGDVVCSEAIVGSIASEGLLTQTWLLLSAILLMIKAFL